MNYEIINQSFVLSVLLKATVAAHPQQSAYSVHAMHASSYRRRITGDDPSALY